MGIVKIFTKDSDLVSFGGAEVDKVVQRIYFGIDNETVCSHCELGLLNDTGLPRQNRDTPSDRLEFIANRPFMFFVEHDICGALFLFGKVTDPNVVC